MAFPHSEFEELCALALTGELSEEDWRRLGEHLQYCPLCRDTLRDHTEIAAIAAAHYSTAHDPLVSPDFDVAAGERRLMRELKRRPNGGSGGKLMSFIVFGLAGALTLFASSLALREHRQHLADLALLSEARSHLHTKTPALPAAPPRIIPVNQAIDTPKLREDRERKVQRFDSRENSRFLSIHKLARPRITTKSRSESQVVSIELADLQIAEIDQIEVFSNLFEPDIFPSEHLADENPALMPTDVACIVDTSGLEVSRIDICLCVARQHPRARTACYKA